MVEKFSRTVAAVTATIAVTIYLEHPFLEPVMGTSIVIAALTAASMGAGISSSEVERQNGLFKRYWGTEFVWKFDELPASARVPNYRIPYSGYIYPDTAGGTVNALSKYDYAYNRGRSSAASYERWDTSAFQEPQESRGGLFGLRRVTRMATPNWYGHCNGWAAAAIRHAEPERSVRVNGVTFSPADIKALLAEIYIYNENENLAGPTYPINAGAFHAILANWLGRGGHPIGMEADPGEEKWNYPIFGYTSSATRYNNGQVAVWLKLSYSKNTRGEYQRGPRIEYTKSFHYYLNLNSQGEITGGGFYRDSSMIDMLWMPVRPKQGRQEGNERGNPHVDVNRVLAIWRASVSDDSRQKWPVIDPPAEDRFTQFTDITTLIPVQDVDAATEVAVAEDAAADEPATGPEEPESADGDSPATGSDDESASEESTSDESASEEPATEEAATE
jgi:hypothetical protein